MFICDICGKEFDNPMSLGGHKSSHSRGEGFKVKKKINCAYCDIEVEVYKKDNKKYCSYKCNVEHKRHIRDNKPYIDGSGQVWNISYGEFVKIKNTPSICEICGVSESHNLNGKNTKMAMDHDHETGIFRGRLCSSCNRNLGWYERNKESIEKYLR